MKKILLFILFVVLVAVVWMCVRKEAPLAEGEGRLKLERVKSPYEMVVLLAHEWARSLPEKPAELKDLPAGMGGKVEFFAPKLGQKDIPAVMDCYDGGKQRYVLYIDTDGDNLLSDERAFMSKPIRRHWFGSVDYYRLGPIAAGYGDTESQSIVEFYASTIQDGRFLSLYPARYRLGKVRLDGEIYKLAIVDGNLDGRYDKMISLPVEKFGYPGCDSFAIDLNGDRRFDWSYGGNSEIMPLSRMVRLKDIYYSINVASDGSALELRKVQPEFGTLNLGGMEINLKLWSEAAEQFLSGTESQWQLPAGKYSAKHLTIVKMDSEGNKWTFTDNRNAGQLAEFEIIAGQETVFKIGPPFLVKPNTAAKPGEVLISFELQGHAGEQYSNRVTKNGKAQPKPRFEIMDESGNILASGPVAQTQ
jgi:hypothetical protein